MSGFFDGLTDRGATPALVATMSFTHARHKVIAENIANASTPGYKAKHLDDKAFQKALGEAFERRGSDMTRPFAIEGSSEVRTDGRGRLVVTPATQPGRNLLFHDGTNVSVEQEMTDLATNAMLHELTTTLLGGRFESLRKAIRGRT